MKKIFLVGVAVATLVGCSSNDDLQTIIPPVEETVTTEQLCSKIPFNFGGTDFEPAAGEGTTRGTTTVKYDTIQNLGLFCLAKRPINDGITQGMKPSWSGKSSAWINQLSIWKKNVSVSLRHRQGDSGSKVIWDSTMNGDYFPYYPDKDWFAYGFVLYYPRTENILYTQTTVRAYIKLDGTKRVSYSMAKAPKTVIGNYIDTLGFSKSYYEAIDPDPGMEEWIYPFFNFQALTSGIRFSFYSKELPNTNFHIDKVEFDGFPCIMSLDLATMLRYADKTGYDMKSSIRSNPFILNDSIFNSLDLSQFPEMTSAFGYYELHEDDGSSISGKLNADGSYKYTLNTDTITVGGTIYIPPVYRTHTRANPKVYITIADDAGNKYKCQSPVVLNAPKKGWKKGTVYTYKLWLNNPSEVAKDASLADWSVEETYDVDATGTTWEEVE